MTTTATTGRTATLGFLFASAAALLLAVRLPLDVVVFGLLVVGVAHLGYEVRYVTGRYRGLLQGRILVAVSAALVLIILGRLVFHGNGWALAEIGILAVAMIVVVLARIKDPLRRRVGVALVGAAALVAATHPESWFLAQAWLHNLVPVVFLWHWSSRLSGDADRRWFRAVTLVWLLVIPVAMLVGVFDAWLQSGSKTADAIASGAGVTTTIVPGGIDGAMTMAPRLIAAFAFLQLLHYTVWIWHFPRVDREATQRFESTPVGSVLRDWRLPALAIAVSMLLAVVAWFDYRSGRGLYTSLAAYHAYLEYPVLLAIALCTPGIADELGDFAPGAIDPAVLVQPAGAMR